MRARPSRYCAGCGRGVEPRLMRGNMCAECRRQTREDHKKDYAARARRGEHAVRYGHAWVKKRRRFLRNNPLCAPCLACGRTTPATEVDHRIPFAFGGTDEYNNYQPICAECHRRKSAYEGSLGAGRSEYITLKEPNDARLWGMEPRRTVSRRNITEAADSDA